MCVLALKIVARFLPSKTTLSASLALISVFFFAPFKFLAGTSWRFDAFRDLIAVPGSVSLKSFVR